MCRYFAFHTFFTKLQTYLFVLLTQLLTALKLSFGYWTFFRSIFETCMIMQQVFQLCCSQSSIISLWVVCHIFFLKSKIFFIVSSFQIESCFSDGYCRLDRLSWKLPGWLKKRRKRRPSKWPSRPRKRKRLRRKPSRKRGRNLGQHARLTRFC